MCNSNGWWIWGDIQIIYSNVSIYKNLSEDRKYISKERKYWGIKAVRKILRWQKLDFTWGEKNKAIEGAFFGE